MSVCIYWKNGTCFKGQKCLYSHGDVKHRQYPYPNKSVKSKQHSRYSRSPGQYDYSPNRKSRSPIRYFRRSRSPRRFSRSPRRFSRSPRRFSRSPRRFSRSPQRYRRSPQRFRRSPKRFSPSPRRGSHSPKRLEPDRYNYSPGSYHQRNIDNQDLRWLQGNSPKPPPDVCLSHSINDDLQTSNFVQDELGNNFEFDSSQPNSNVSFKECKEASDTDLNNGSNPPPISNSSPPKDSSPSENKADLENISGGITVKPSTSVDNMYMDFSPSRAMDIIKSLPKDFFSFPFKTEEQNTPVDEADTKNSTTLPNVKDGAAFPPPVAKSQTLLPPVTRHCEDALRFGVQLPPKLFPINDDPPVRRDQMWTPAMDRNKTKSFNLPLISNWEVDTPYVSRSNPNVVPGPSAVAQQIEKTSKDKAPTQKSKTSDSRRKKKRRRKASTSSSDSEEDTPKKKLVADNILTKKKTILAKVWTLMEQKKKLDTQRGEILLNHKSDAKNLPNILSENAFLSKEIDKQIFVMNEMIQGLNEEMGISVMDSHQQEFYLRNNLLRDERTASGGVRSSAPKFPVVGSTEKLDYAEKFLKPIDAQKPDDEKKAKNYEDKYHKKRVKEKDRTDNACNKSKKDSIKSKGKAEVKKDSVKDSKPLQQVNKEANKGNDKTASSKKHDPDEEYAPSANLKPYVKYIDQGMHWCDLCTQFPEYVAQYICHLQSKDHMAKLKIDKKKWLPKHVPIVKETAPKNAPVLTIPIQGVEFMHSLIAYYCSLCDLTIKTQEEAKEHPETKIHVSKYKEYLSKNPMYETTYIKDKMAAFAKYSVEKEKAKVTFFSKRGETGPPLPKKELATKQAKAIVPAAQKEPVTKQAKAIVLAAQKVPKPPFFMDTEKQLDVPMPTEAVREVLVSDIKSEVIEKKKTAKSVKDKKVCSIRVASRASKSTEEKQIKAEEQANVSPVEPIPDPPLSVTNKEADKNIQIDNPDTSKFHNLKIKVGLPERNASGSVKPLKKKMSNVMIGKMPFLKRNRRELVITHEKPDLIDVTKKVTETVPSESILPQVIPKNLEYITEIVSSGSETKFTKVIGPTQPSNDGNSDMEIEQTGSPVKKNENTSPVTSSNAASSTQNDSTYLNVTANQDYYQPQIFNNYSTPPPTMLYQPMNYPTPHFQSAVMPQYSQMPLMSMEMQYHQMDNSRMPYSPKTKNNIDINLKPIEAIRATTPPPPGTETVLQKFIKPVSPKYTTKNVPSVIESNVASTDTNLKSAARSDLHMAKVSPMEMETVIEDSNERNPINIETPANLTLMEAIVQDQTDNVSLDISGQGLCHNPGSRALSEELCQLENMQNELITLSSKQTSELFDLNITSVNEACSTDRNDHDDQILEGLQLLDGAESSDESEED